MTAKKTPFAVVTCPHCDAPFRVALDNPRLRRGGVRGKCTQCDGAFDVVQRLRAELRRQKTEGGSRRTTLPTEDVVMLSDDDVEEISRTPPPPPPPPPPHVPSMARDRPDATAAASGTIEIPDSPPTLSSGDGVTNQAIEDDVAAPISVPLDSPPRYDTDTVGLEGELELEDPPPTDGELPLDDLIPPLPEPFDPAHRAPSPLPIAPTQPDGRQLGPPGVEVDLPFSTSELPPIEEAEPLGPPLPKRPTVEVSEVGGDESEAPPAAGAPGDAKLEDDSAPLAGLEEESLELEVEVRPPDSVPPEPLDEDDPLHWSWVRAARPAASALLRRADEEYPALAELLAAVSGRAGDEAAHDDDGAPAAPS